jgi:hypothetical protein
MNLINPNGGQLMKNKIFAASALFAVTLASQGFASDAGIVYKQASDQDSSYCHIKYMAYTEESLKRGTPEFNETDIVDLYGSCSFDPTSQVEVSKQISAMGRSANGDGSNDSSSN